MAFQRDQQHLKKVGSEGFALIDECFGRTRRPILSQSRRLLQSPQPQVHRSHNHQSFLYHVQHHQQSYVCQVPQVYTVTKEPVITDSYYHGTSQHQYNDARSISEGPQAFVAKESVAATSNEAAKLYGGTMVIDYSKNKQLRRPYY